MDNVKLIIEKLTKNNKTIATMESCSGGALINALTSIEGASKVIKFSAITYSNEYKIKMGVSAKIIDKYSVYSFECAKEMSKVICNYANSNIGIGITGKLQKPDEDNLYGNDNEVFISIYNKDINNYYVKKFICTKKNRVENKNDLINFIIDFLIDNKIIE